MRVSSHSTATSREKQSQICRATLKAILKRTKMSVTLRKINSYGYVHHILKLHQQNLYQKSHAR